MKRQLTPRHRENIRRGIERWHERRRVRPSDLQALRRTGTVAPSILPLLAVAEGEVADLLDALGGVDSVSPQRRMLVEDVARVGIVLRAELTRYAQSADPDAAARVGTLAGARRASLALLGLERHAREVSLPAYLKAQAATNGHADGPTVDVESERAPRADGERKQPSESEGA